MKLSNIAILALRGISLEAKKSIAKALGVSMPSFYRYVSENHDNLTKAAVLELIRKETGLTDSEILEKETEPQGTAPTESLQ